MTDQQYLNKAVEGFKKVWIFSQLKIVMPDFCQLHVLSEYLVEPHCRRVKKRPILFVAISHRWAIKFHLSFRQVFCIDAFFRSSHQLISNNISRPQKRVLRKVRVTRCYLGILVTEYLLHLIQRTSRIHEKAGKAVPQVVQAHIL